MGNVALDVVHVPGHTPEHLGLLVTDRTRSGEPWCALTGHPLSLMLRDIPPQPPNFAETRAANLGQTVAV